MKSYVGRYESRFEAGKALTEFIQTNDEELYYSILQEPENNFCFAIPNGGVPIAEGFCLKLGLKYDILIVRKIKIPYNPEAGFGSVTTDGTILINEGLLSQIGLTKAQVNNSINITKREIEERLRLYDKDPNVKSHLESFLPGKRVFLIDDGLASGFTMKAAIKMVRKYAPEKIYIAVPTAPLRTIVSLKESSDNIYCPKIKRERIFAVANAYKHWRDIQEHEIIEILDESDYYYNLQEKVKH